jgi:hypothetical protein
MTRRLKKQSRLTVIIAVSVLVIIATCIGIYIYIDKPGAVRMNRYRPKECQPILDRNGSILDYTCSPALRGIRIRTELASIDQGLRDLFQSITPSITRDLSALLYEQKYLDTDSSQELLRTETKNSLIEKINVELSADQQLELYLNLVPLAPGIFGVESAARLFFDHTAQKLSPHESLLLFLLSRNNNSKNHPWFGGTPNEWRAIVSATQHRDVFERADQRFHTTQKLFLHFIEKWAASAPKQLYAHNDKQERTYPAISALTPQFRIGQLSLFRSLGYLKFTKNRSTPIHTTLDRSLQKILIETPPFEETPQIQRWNSIIEPKSTAVVLIEDDQIRAFVCTDSKKAQQLVLNLAGKITRSTTVDVVPCNDITRAQIAVN